MIITQKLVTLKTVQQAIETIKAQGEKPSNRNLRRALGGGSPNEIQAIVRQIQDSKAAGVELVTELPANVQNSLLTGLHSIVKDVTCGLQIQVQDARDGQTEALAELEIALAHIDELKDQLNQSIDQGKTSAARAVNLEMRISELKDEREQLLEAGEAARLTATKVAMQLERADQLAERTGQRVELLTETLEAEKGKRVTAEKDAAVSLQKASEVESIRSRAVDLERQVESWKCRCDDLIKVLHEAEMKYANRDKELAVLEGRLAVLGGEIVGKDKELERLQGAASRATS